MNMFLKAYHINIIGACLSFIFPTTKIKCRDCVKDACLRYFQHICENLIFGNLFTGQVR